MGSSDRFEWSNKAYNKYCRIGEEDKNYTVQNMCTVLRNIYRNIRFSIIPSLIFLNNLNTDFGNLDIVNSYYFGYSFILNSEFIRKDQIFAGVVLHTYESSFKSITGNLYFGEDDNFTNARATWRYLT